MVFTIVPTLTHTHTYTPYVPSSEGNHKLCAGTYKGSPPKTLIRPTPKVVTQVVTVVKDFRSGGKRVETLSLKYGTTNLRVHPTNLTGPTLHEDPRKSVIGESWK